MDSCISGIFIACGCCLSDRGIQLYPSTSQNSKTIYSYFTGIKQVKCFYLLCKFYYFCNLSRVLDM